MALRPPSAPTALILLHSFRGQCPAVASAVGGLASLSSLDHPWKFSLGVGSVDYQSSLMILVPDWDSRLATPLYYKLTHILYKPFINSQLCNFFFVYKLLQFYETLLKVSFFQKVRFVFQISQSPKKIIPKNYPELERISCLLIWAGISNFNLRIVFWDNFFGRLGDLKNESHSLKKRHL